MEDLSLMKKTATRDVIHRFMLQIYIPIVMKTFIRFCFVIAQEAIGYVINSVGA
jgi:hypothetical protein